MADRLRFLQNPSEDNRRGVTVASAEAAHERIVAALAALRKAHAGRDDAQLVIDEVPRPLTPLRRPLSAHPPDRLRF
jgi:hypothetical protein